jgi:hypothetical protein
MDGDWNNVASKANLLCLRVAQRNHEYLKPGCHHHAPQGVLVQAQFSKRLIEVVQARGLRDNMEAWNRA